MRILSNVAAFIVGFCAMAFGACAELTPAQSAELAFQKTCQAALLLEAAKQGTQLPEQAVRLCNDPGLPGRIVTLLVEAQKLSNELHANPYDDAGPSN